MYLSAGHSNFYHWRDSVRKGREQGERWKREDEQRQQDRNEERARWRGEDDLRKQNRKLDLRFGVQFANNDVLVWISNLGTTAFVVTDVKIDQRPIHPDVAVVDSVSQTSTTHIYEAVPPGATSKISCGHAFRSDLKKIKSTHFDKFFGSSATFDIFIKGVDNFSGSFVDGCQVWVSDVLQEIQPYEKKV